ncbi:DUF2993 domain-containing protein [Agrococcus sp. HG114]|uniref:DUF2993 domain-containing protein n=1 Tax=Agrococcus sp. HG114 TaxID=2969757 RepID=UPI00215A28A3|nr:DUF2993 domain-containing protein [Agrococcus sp. HG114]MCR8671675.1 DUF2993 domain-containing protein [Agrococcus sp. HG114]
MARTRKRGRGAIWAVVALLVVVALVVGAELVARQLVPGMVRTAVAERLQLPPEHPIDVEVGGILLPQLVAGRLADVRVASEDVTVGAFSGDVVAEGRSVPIRGDAPAEGGTAEVRMTTEQLRSLLSTFDGFPADTVELAAPHVTASFDAQVLGASISLGIALEPSASEGDIVLTPVEGTIADATVRADELRERFGALVDPLLQDRRLCIAASVPAGAELRSIEVADDELVASFDLAGGLVDDPALQEPGAC